MYVYIYMKRETDNKKDGRVAHSKKIGELDACSAKMRHDGVEGF